MPTPQHIQDEDLTFVSPEKILKLQAQKTWNSSGSKASEEEERRRSDKETGNQAEESSKKESQALSDSNNTFTSIDTRYHTFLYRRSPNTYTSSYLRPGSRFSGCQQSGRSVYEVYVDIKNIDMENAFICGYLKINGLTDEHPQLITYFEGEIISDKYSFYTNRADWGASRKIDIDHWKRFEPWKRIAKRAQSPEYVHYNYALHDHIYMRWKECFLVPDHRVKDIQGASYAGFYYICFDQIDGSISGYYYHSTSDMYQQLNLTHIADNGCLETYQFR